ncbi:MAG: hypothetical protein FJ224_10985 [Lentisphaerae bacterium]|nr:hypothetical protein [Lentisphaerota bacterium]
MGMNLNGIFRQVRHGQLAAALLLVLVMPGCDSLWIDEGWTAHFGMVPGFLDFWRELLSDKGAECQKPLALLLAWLLGKLAGWSEYAMRATNIGWTIVAVVPMWLLARKRGAPLVLWLFILNSFVWMYTNEARPYAAMIACGAWLVFGLADFIRTETRGGLWPWCFTVAGCTLCALHMLGAVEFGAVIVVAAGIAVRRKWRPTPHSWRILSLSVPVLLILGAYYLWTLTRGYGGAKLWDPGVANIAFSLYELTGFSGLGPPRADLREWMADGSFRSRLGPAMLLGPTLLAAIYSMIAVRALTALRRLSTETLAILWAAAASISILAVAAAVAKWPFWGRHLGAALPFLTTGMALVLHELKWQKLMGPALAAVLLAGSLNLRLNPAYRREDYRSAAAEAKRELVGGNVVWWGADRWTAEYYGLTFGEEPDATLRFMMGNVPAFTDRMPGAVVMSRPSQFDPQGRIREWLTVHGFEKQKELKGFSVWKQTTATGRGK